MKKDSSVLKKSRILGVDHAPNPAEYITAQIELENGEVVIGHYKAFHWLRPPSEVGKDATRRMSLPPVKIVGKLSAKAR